MSIAAMLALAAAVTAVLAVVTLRRVGSGYRVGRLLAGTRDVSIDDAIQLAVEATPRYVRVKGRISSDEEFPDDQDRPLVFRRTRIEVQQPNGEWQRVLDEREAVPFGIETRSSFIAVDETSLSDGLVVIPRVSTGRVADLPADLLANGRPDVDAAAPARLVIEQLSAVEHATICGRPVLRAGHAALTATKDKPLIATTLDEPSAMRVLAAGRRYLVIASALLFVVALGLLAGSVVALLIGA